MENSEFKLDYFDKIHMGGVINSAGMAQQDCASIVYLFRYLEDEQFREITFESTNDFTIRFCNKKEISVQVKMNQFNIDFVSKLLEKYECNPNKKSIFIGSGMDDDFRNLYQKILRYRNAINSYMDDEEVKSVVQSIENKCKEKKIALNIIKNIEFDIIDKINGVNIAQNAIYEWADNKRLYVDVKSIMYELESQIALKFKETGGYLKKEDIRDIIIKHKRKKIVSAANITNNDNRDKIYIVSEIEKIMNTKHIMFFEKLQLLKNYIEMDSIVEALNESEELYYNNPRFESIYAWLLLCNKKYNDVINVCKKSNRDNIFINLLNGRALICLGKWEEAIKVLNEGKRLDDTYEINLELARCYINLKDKSKAFEYFGACKKMEPKRGEIYLEIGKLFAFKDECISYMDEAIRKDKSLTEAYIEKGKVLRYKGKFNEAIKCYEKYMEESQDFDNAFVLTELALSYYNANKPEMSIYIGKWISRIIDFNNYQKLCLEDKLLIVDIGYEYSNFTLVVKKTDKIEIFINADYCQELYYNDESLSGIGLFIPPTNRFLISYMDNYDEETINEKASIPTIYKIFNRMDGYLKTKEKILEQNVLSINHEWKGYVEYLDKNNNVNAKIYKKTKSMDIMIHIGEFTICESFQSVDKGYYGFTCKLEEDGIFKEAAIVLQGPEENFQITFSKNNIKINKTLIL